MGRSRGGLTTKLHALVDADGPVSLRLTGGQVHDACEAEALIEAVPEGARLFGDKGYDSTARSIPADPIIVRRNWLRASDWTTDRGAGALNDYARTNDPFARVGKQQIAVNVSSGIRASPDSFRVAWTERQFACFDSALERDPDDHASAAA